MRFIASLLAFALVVATLADDPAALPPEEHVARAAAAIEALEAGVAQVRAEPTGRDGCRECACDDQGCDSDCGEGGAHCDCFHPHVRVLMSAPGLVAMALAPPRILVIPRAFATGDERDAHRLRLIRPPTAARASLG